MLQIRAAVLAALFSILTSFSALAQDITLTGRDGAVEISGTLLGFDGEFYRIQTLFGELTVDGTGVSCEGPGCPSLTPYVAEVVISGARSMAEVLLPALVESFALRNGLTILRDAATEDLLQYVLSTPQTGQVVARFAIRSRTTSQGFADVMANEADIVMALREIRTSEAQRAQSLGLGDMRRDNRSRVLALSALIPVNQAENPVRAISPLQLAQVFAGEIDNWQALGGADAPISLHLPSRDSGLVQAIEDELMRPAQLDFAENIRFHKRLNNLVWVVKNDPFALGITTFERIGAAAPLQITGGCGHAIAASRRGIKTEDYPLSTPLYLYIPALRQPKIVRDFLRFASSQPAQIVIRRAGFVDQAFEEIPLSEQGQRLANAIARAGDEISLEALQAMVQDLSSMSRLTPTFRFKPGSTELDAHSLSNVQRLAQQLERGRYDERALTFVGFSDGSGAATLNHDVALRRAQAVREAVINAAETADLSRIKLSATGYGEALPVACDDTVWGRGVNRRVEVWLR